MNVLKGLYHQFKSIKKEEGVAVSPEGTIIPSASGEFRWIHHHPDGEHSSRKCAPNPGGSAAHKEVVILYWYDDD